MREGHGRPNSKPATSSHPQGKLLKPPTNMLHGETLVLGKISSLCLKNLVVKPGSLGSSAKGVGSLGQGLVTWALAIEHVWLPRAFSSSTSGGSWGTWRARGPRWARQALVTFGTWRERRGAGRLIQEPQTEMGFSWGERRMNSPGED